MASDLGGVATETPSLQPAQQTPASPSTSSSNLAAVDGAARSNPLKRAREETAASPSSPASKSARIERRTSNPIQRTAAAALEAERRRKQQELPQAQPRDIEASAEALKPLMQSTTTMSRPSDAPAAPTANMEPATKAATSVAIPPAGAEGTTATSPQSATSKSIPDATVTESPTAMDVDRKTDDGQPGAQEEKANVNSLSYPGPLPTGGSMPAPPSRGMSYPMPSSGQTSPTSGTPKKHKCPFCDTVFTRHHNLKSHLLTHSQEKPYLCQQCDMRFRRLHDLKRHGKLHTGEKPHVCPKCDRKFARGDALARHSKGAGGCAGRRSSMGGSFAEDSVAEGDDSTMSGVYEEGMTEEERRRQGLPSIKAQHVAGQSHSQTYPPGRAPQRAATTGGLFPPSTSSTATSPSMPNSTGSGHTPNTSISSMPMSAGSGSMYSQGMTESPKPLSPAVPNHPGQDGVLGRQRSPSMTHQLQHQQYGRRQSGRRTPPNLSLPPGAANRPPAVPIPHAGRQSTRGPSGSQGDTAGTAFGGDLQGLWAYVQNLEDRLVQLEGTTRDQQEVINTLMSDNAELKRQRDGGPTLVASPQPYGSAASPEPVSVSKK